MLGVIGVNHISADLHFREHIGQALSDLVTSTPNLLATPHVIVQTCSRTEWYYSTDKPFELHVEMFAHLRRLLDDSHLHRLYSYFGVNCFIHLHRVVSGIDSAFFGETEIQGQIKRAYNKSVEEKKISSELHYLFQKALHAGKIIRKELPQSMTAPLQIERTILEKLEIASKVKPIFPLLFVGASAINYRICRAIHNAYPNERLIITNRTECKAHEFAEKFGIEHTPFQDAMRTWNQFASLIFAVKTTEKNYLLSYIDNDQLCNTLPCQRPLIVDLGVPRNIHPNLEHTLFQLHNIETLFPKIAPEAQKIAHHADTLARRLAIQYYRKHTEHKKCERKELDSNSYVEEELVSC